MSAFEDFSELLERSCFNSWRSAIGRDDDFILSCVSSVLYTKEEVGGKWRFSFALRKNGRWHQCQRDIEPVAYDPYDPPPAGEFDPKKSMSPQNVASQLASEMLCEVARMVVSDDR